MKKILAIVLVLVMLAAMSGCSLLEKVTNFKKGLDDIGNIIDDVDPDDDDDGDDNDDGNDNPLLNSNVFYPGSVFDIMAEFKEFGYTWEETLEDGSPNDFSLRYTSMEGDEINGEATVVFDVYTTETDKDDKTFRFWFTDDWNCVKALRDGEEVESFEGGTLTMMLSIYVNYIKLTKLVINDEGKLESFSHTLQETRTEACSLGSMDVLIISDNFRPIVRTYGLVDLDGEQMFTVLRVDHDNSERFQELRITQAVKR